MPSGKQVAVFLAHAAAATGVPGGDLLDIAAFVQLQHITHAAVGVPGGGVQLAFDVAAREELDGAAARSTTGKDCCCYREPWCGDFQCVDMPLIANEEGAGGTCPTAHFDKGEFKKAHGWCQRMLGHGAVGRNAKVVQDRHPTSKVHALCGDKTGDSSRDYEDGGNSSDLKLVNADSPDLNLVDANLKSEISAVVEGADKDGDKMLDKREQEKAFTSVIDTLKTDYSVDIKISSSSVVHRSSVTTSEFISELETKVKHYDSKLTSMSGKYSTGSGRGGTSGSYTDQGSSTFKSPSPNSSSTGSYTSGSYTDNGSSSNSRFDGRLGKTGSSTSGSYTNQGGSASSSHDPYGSDAIKKYHFNPDTSSSPGYSSSADSRGVSPSSGKYGGEDSGLAQERNGKVIRNIATNGRDRKYGEVLGYGDRISNSRLNAPISKDSYNYQPNPYKKNYS